MKSTKIVHLLRVKEMLAELEKARLHILAGQASGFYAVFCDNEGTEETFLGGVYKEDRKMAVRAALKLSVARMSAEDPPLAHKL